MNILFLAAEVGPYVSVGGLSQVIYFLSRALKSQGHDVRIATPRYGAMEKHAPRRLLRRINGRQRTVLVDIEHRQNTFKRKASSRREIIECFFSEFAGASRDDVKTYFMENREYFGLRSNVFGYTDDHTRFALFSKAVLELLCLLNEEKKSRQTGAWWPDVIHCHDWHTSYFIELARAIPRYNELLKKIPIVLTVHNFHYQGVTDFRYLPKKEQDKGVAPLAAISDPKLRQQNPLRRGLIYADAVTTVSPSHAAEVLTPEYSEGLDDTLNSIRKKLEGILNGIDTKEFNPSTDKIIKKNYNDKSFALPRLNNKIALQREFGLPVDAKRPLLAYSGRLAQQKGVDLMLEALPRLLSEYPLAQMVVLGGGDDQYRQRLSQMARNYPKQIGLHLMPNFRLPRKIFAGADILLVPSLFEPGGIVALEALRYGAAPVVRHTGGLKDIVNPFNPATGQGNGFAFTGLSAWSLYGALVRALTAYSQPRLWHRLIKNCLRCDFSWSHAAGEYANWYARAVHKRRAKTAKKS